MSRVERARDIRNEKSKAKARHDGEPWSENELEMLREWFYAGDMEGLAEILGRTVEACRQQFYLDRQQQTREVVKKEEAVKAVKKVDKWSQGFTSLADMGF